MIHLTKGRMLLGATVLWGLTGLPPARALAPVDPDVQALYESAARHLAVKLPTLHLNREPLDAGRAAAAFDLFLTSLDHDRSYFLASDVERFRHQAMDLAEALREGDLAMAFEVYEILMERVTDRVAFTERLLEEGIDPEEPGRYVWQRREEPWPAHRGEWDALWRDKVRHLYVGRLVARALAEEEAQAQQENQPSEEVGDPGDAPDDSWEKEEATEIEDELLRLSPEELVLKHVRRHYEALRDHDAHWLLALYLNAFARAYDPHSNYLSADNAEDFDIHMRLSLVGIGAVLSREEGAAKVERVIPGGPADRDGRLKPGDRIVAVAQEGESLVDVLYWPLSRTVRLIRGEKDTRVTLSVIPASDPSGSRIRRIELVRDEVRLEERAARAERHDGAEEEGGAGASLLLAVITVPDFYADMRARGQVEARSVTRDVSGLIRDLLEDGLDGLVLDLRNNGGGSLPEALDMTGLFIDSGPVVQVRNRDGVAVLSTADPDCLFRGPLVILVNRHSASASEIVAAALKDYGRALVVGDARTHGKGTVQRKDTLVLNPRDPRYGELKVTTESFYRIAGGSTQREGVTPHIHLPSPLDVMEIGEGFLPHAMPWSTVRPALYRRDADLDPLVPELRQRSEERRAKDEDFAAYLRLIDVLQERWADRSMPLDLTSRLAMARAERDLADYRAGQEADEDSGNGEERGRDLVLEETLRVLADLVHLRQAGTSLAADGAP